MSQLAEYEYYTRDEIAQKFDDCLADDMIENYSYGEGVVTCDEHGEAWIVTYYGDGRFGVEIYYG